MSEKIWTKPRIISLSAAIAIIIIGIILYNFAPEVWNRIFLNYAGPGSPFVQPP